MNVNEVNKTNECEEDTAQNVGLTILPSQLIQYLQNLDQRIDEDNKKEIHEQFRNIRSFQNILGTSSSFKLIDNRSFFGNSDTIITPQSLGSLPIKVYRSSAPNTWAMSLHNEREPAFLSYVTQSNVITVFCPEVQEPIGRILRRTKEGEADIFSLANGKTFTLKNLESDTPGSMIIIDSQERIVCSAKVIHWKEGTRCTTGTDLKQFVFQVEDSLSEPSKVMLFVCFANWANWTNDKISKKNRIKKLILLFLVAKIILFIVLFIVHGNI